ALFIVSRNDKQRAKSFIPTPADLTSARARFAAFRACRTSPRRSRGGPAPPIRRALALNRAAVEPLPCFCATSGGPSRRDHLNSWHCVAAWHFSPDDSDRAEARASMPAGA